MLTGYPITPGSSSMVWRVKSEGVLEGKVAIVTGTSRGVGVGIAHELLARRRHRHRLLAVEARRASPAPTTTKPGCSAAPRWSATKAITARSTRWSPRSSTPTGASTSWSTTPAAPCRRPHVEDVPELVSQDPGRAPCRRRFRADRAVSRLRHPDEPDQPAVVRHPRLPADARPGRRRARIINISSGAGHPAGSPDAGVLRRGEGGAQPPHPLAGRGVGTACAGQLRWRWARR